MYQKPEPLKLLSKQQSNNFPFCCSREPDRSEKQPFSGISSRMKEVMSPLMIRWYWTLPGKIRRSSCRDQRSAGALSHKCDKTPGENIEKSIFSILDYAPDLIYFYPVLREKSGVFNKGGLCWCSVKYISHLQKKQRI